MNDLIVLWGYSDETFKVVESHLSTCPYRLIQCDLCAEELHDSEKFEHRQECVIAQGMQPERKVAISKISKDEKLNNHLNQFKFGMSHSSEASNV